MFSSWHADSVALMIDSSESAGGSWFTILNSESFTPRALEMLRADSWIFLITRFLLFSSMSRVSAFDYLFIGFWHCLLELFSDISFVCKKSIIKTSYRSPNVLCSEYCLLLLDAAPEYLNLHHFQEKIRPNNTNIQRRDKMIYSNSSIRKKTWDSFKKETKVHGECNP